MSEPICYFLLGTMPQFSDTLQIICRLACICISIRRIVRAHGSEPVTLTDHIKIHLFAPATPATAGAVRLLREYDDASS